MRTILIVVSVALLLTWSYPVYKATIGGGECSEAFALALILSSTAPISRSEPPYFDAEMSASSMNHPGFSSRIAL